MPAKANGDGAHPVLCEARDVWHEVTLPNGAPLRVLEDVTLAIRAREVVALLGPSGCGKSTILRILAGLLRPTRGQALYHGEPLQGLNPGVALVFQSFALYPWMTVAQNVQAVLKAAGLPPGEIKKRAESALRLVGLSGFEDSYPRELSGGMKQRVGMARALSVDPEILFLDEPFSQVDALTAESLRAEVLDIWGSSDRHPSSVVMVSHDIKEVAYMADRIVILGTHPGRVRTVVENKLPRPRDYRSPQLLKLIDQLHEVITGHELPDAPTPAAAATAAALQPLPEATVGEVIGLLEYLDARGGKEELFKIAAETNQEIGRLIGVVIAAEMLDFVDTPKRMVVLEPTGLRFVRAGGDERKAIWGEQLLQLRLFHDICDLVQKQPDRTLDQDIILETIIMRMPQENYERVFQTFVRWAQYGGLFHYDEDKERILMEQGAPT
jgi:NitT/TauT family transport system ATP-binding protein